MKTQREKKLYTLLDLCVSSLRRGHANLLCIVPILTDDPRRESKHDVGCCIFNRVESSFLDEVGETVSTGCVLDAFFCRSTFATHELAIELKAVGILMGAKVITKKNTRRYNQSAY